MVSMHLSEDAPIKEPLGIAFRGGPINGPYAAAAAATIKRIADERGVHIAHVYGNSAGVSAASMLAIGRHWECLDIWSRIEPQDIIDKSWFPKVTTMGRVVLAESIYTSTGLDRLIYNNIPIDDLYAADATPLSIMTVDYDTGDPLVFTNTDPAFKPVFSEGILASMALTPFLRLRTIWAGPKGLSVTRRTAEDMCVRLMDGGYRDNVMIECAARDGINTLLIVDINGLRVAPQAPGVYKHWAGPLQMAFHTLITTNDQRNLYGATRVNEELSIRDDLSRVAHSLPEEHAEKLKSVIAQMDHGRLELAKKHHMRVHLVEDPDYVIPFDFSDFTRAQTAYLIVAGHRAAQRTMEHLT